jgi:tripartite-type tricarboxylate transporter receptor subunit TctC
MSIALIRIGTGGAVPRRPGAVRTSCIPGILAGCLLAVTVAYTASPAAAAGYPSRPVRLVLAFPPGGASDFVGRLIALRLGEQWSQTVLVDNRGGAGGNVGAEIAARAPADGHTMLLANNGILAANAVLYPKLAYDPVRDFIPVTLIALQPNVLVVHPSVPASNVRELVALARARPGQLNYASSGSGLAAHLAAELFSSLAQVQMVHVPYKGAGPALTDLISGQTQLMFATSTSVVPHVKSGRLRALATTAAKRSAGFEDLPTVAEAGVPGFEATSWHGIVLPAGATPGVVGALSTALNQALKHPELRERFAQAGAEPVGGTPAQFAAHIRAEIPRWEKVIRQSGAKPE